MRFCSPLCWARFYSLLQRLGLGFGVQGVGLRSPGSFALLQRPRFTDSLACALPDTGYFSLPLGSRVG